MQFNYDEQPIRRDVTIDYKMETKTINGQHYTDLNRAALQNPNANVSQQPDHKTYPVQVTLPTKQWDNVRNFRPFLESATPEEKLNLLQKTLFKPKKRLKKLMEKRDQLVATKLAQQKKNQINKNKAAEDPFGVLPLGENRTDIVAAYDNKIKCPVYKCISKFERSEDLDAHYQHAHKDLIALGLSLG